MTCTQKSETPCPADVESIHRLLQPYALENIILERSREEIAKSIDKFLVASYNKDIVGAVSYYDYGPVLKEVRSLAVRKDVGNNGPAPRWCEAC